MPYCLSSCSLSDISSMGRISRCRPIHRDSIHRKANTPDRTSRDRTAVTAKLFIDCHIIRYVSRLACGYSNTCHIIPILSRLDILYCEHLAEWLDDLSYTGENTHYLIHGACPV